MRVMVSIITVVCSLINHCRYLQDEGVIGQEVNKLCSGTMLSCFIRNLTLPQIQCVIWPHNPGSYLQVLRIFTQRLHRSIAKEDTMISKQKPPDLKKTQGILVMARMQLQMSSSIKQKVERLS